MRYALTFVAALLAAAPVHAEVTMLAKKDGDSIRLQDKPCTSAATLAHIPEQHRKEFRAASAIVDGQGYQACWSMLPGGVVWLTYDDGDVSQVPVQAFKIDEGV